MKKEIESVSFSHPSLGETTLKGHLKEKATFDTGRIVKKVYISGPISGHEKAATILFKAAENDFKTRLVKFEVVNPMELPHDHDKSWTSYLREDIKALADCDVIFMLANWTNSKGAKIEWELAQNLGIEIIYQK
jgi:hypothetical protein